MNKKEKIYLIAIIVLLGILVVKSLYLDEYKPVTEEEVMFKEYAEKIIDEKFNGFFSRNKLIRYKIVSIKKVDNTGVSIIQVKNQDEDEYKNVEIKGKYVARIRKYLFNILPFSQDKVLSRE
ncbi:hypothetical protein R9X47_13205 [Wukongibacter baidiensis]|uniref:hypothetical protein n=1 Tax=Wukongibacter baidiensis TaxID=1723361 RepID=UPI003D7F9FA7